MKRLAALIILGLAAGCGAPTPPPPVGSPTAHYPQSTPRPTGYQAVPYVDQCGASELQWLVGQPRTQIPVPVDVTSRRVACTTCPLTEEYSPRRLNILFDRDTGLVEQVRCG